MVYQPTELEGTLCQPAHLIKLLFQLLPIWHRRSCKELDANEREQRFCVQEKYIKLN